MVDDAHIIDIQPIVSFRTVKNIKVVQLEAAAGEAIQFFKTTDSYEGKLVVGEPISILGFIEESWFLRKRELRIRIVDVL